MNGGEISRSSDKVAFGFGFHDAEQENGLPFRWMSARGRLEWQPAAGPRFLELDVCAETRDLSQTITIETAEGAARYTLVHGWATLSVAVPAASRSADVRVSHALPAQHHPADSRTLTVRVRSPRLHGDGERHRAVTSAAGNSERNMREMLASATRLESTPVSLGVDMHGACNVKPPCVYCEWDSSKRLEGANAERPFTRETLRDYGRFFEQASQLVNCSIGEPFMKRDLPEILALIDEHGAFLDMSTNGQILTEDQLRALIGRRVRLYVSIDAATAETYASLRNRRFDTVVGNVRRIVEAKGGRGRQPLVFLVFMPMSANLRELDAFARLCADIEVDQLVLRPLNADPELDLRWSRAEYSFTYQRELLPLEERIRLSGYAYELCRALGVPLANQLDFGGSTSQMFTQLFEEGRERARRPTGNEKPASANPPQRSPDAPLPATYAAQASTDSTPAVADTSLSNVAWPLCTEPWRTVYILRRGILPCCYGGRPIAPMDGLEEAWNGATLQSIREALARGRFHRYCLRTPTCPIVQKHRRVAPLPLRERGLAFLYDVWFLSNRGTGGLPRRIWRTIKGTR